MGIVAVSADEVSETAGLQTRVPHVALYADTTLAATKAWGLLVPGGEHPSPGTFIVADGKVTYRRLEDRRGDWPAYRELAAALH